MWFNQASRSFNCTTTSNQPTISEYQMTEYIMKIHKWNRIIPSWRFSSKYLLQKVKKKKKKRSIWHYAAFYAVLIKWKW